MAPVLLFGKASDDPCLSALAEAVRHRGGEPIVVVTRRPLPLDLDLRNPESSSVAGIRAEALAGAFVGALPPRHGLDPHRPAAPIAPEAFLERQAGLDGQRDAACALLSWLHRRGRGVLNPPIGGTYVQNKLEHLTCAVEAGLDVPASRWAGERGHAVGPSASLEQRAENWVEKPVRGGGATREAGPDPLADPARFAQRRLAGRPVRAYVLDGRLLSAAAIAGTTALDHRSDPVFQRGQARYEPLTLDGDTERRLAILLERLGLRFAGVDFLDEDGRLWFLEANAAPIFVEQEERTGHAIAGPLADALLEAKLDGPAAV